VLLNVSRIAPNDIAKEPYYQAHSMHVGGQQTQCQANQPAPKKLQFNALCIVLCFY